MEQDCKNCKNVSRSKRLTGYRYFNKIKLKTTVMPFVQNLLCGPGRRKKQERRKIMQKINQTSLIIELQKMHLLLHLFFKEQFLYWYSLNS